MRKPRSLWIQAFLRVVLLDLSMPVFLLKQIWRKLHLLIIKFVKWHKILQKLILKNEHKEDNIWTVCVPEVTLRIYVQTISRESYLSSVFESWWVIMLNQASWLFERLQLDVAFPLSDDSNLSLSALNPTSNIISIITSRPRVVTVENYNAILLPVKKSTCAKSLLILCSWQIRASKIFTIITCFFLPMKVNVSLILPSIVNTLWYSVQLHDSLLFA